VCAVRGFSIHNWIFRLELLRLNSIGQKQIDEAVWRTSQKE
jgi:hypothetical protein